MHRPLFIFYNMTVCLRRKLDRKLGTLRVIRSHTDIGPVIFDDLTDDGQSETGAILLGRKIGLKNSRPYLCRDPIAIVRDLQIDDPSRAVMTGGDFDFAISRDSRYRIV